MPGSSPEKPTDQVETPKGIEAEVETKTPDVATSAESSPAETKGEDKGDMLSAVKAALKPDTEKAPDSGEQGSKPEKPEAPAAEGDAEDDLGDLTEEEHARLRPKTRKRIENLLKDRSDRDEKLAVVEPKADQFDKLVRFIDDAGLSKDEVNRGFDVMNQLKNNPLRAYETLRPIMDQLEQIVGVRLPEDLQNAVRLGQITEQHAQELSSARGRSTVTQQQLERRDQQDREKQEREAFDGQVSTVAGKVSEWERSQAKNDPDWQLKQPRIKDRIDLEILRRKQTEPRYFPSVEEAIAISKKALEAVNEEFKKLAPARREIRPGHTDAAATRSTAQAKNPLEAAKLALAAIA